ncbi:hypothetical protein B0T19DRAFT_235665 [Cercophora scortea]|uniref:Transmembrane protein n=1 Tax=Cercophora scortea TaxID=314031 RepID=A0AAE0MAL6_9PEZI|nr:hypothetical protein B0T19DRAFT_235665 [Cercophora scortea]
MPAHRMHIQYLPFHDSQRACRSYKPHPDVFHLAFLRIPKGRKADSQGGKAEEEEAFYGFPIFLFFFFPFICLHPFSNLSFFFSFFSFFFLRLVYFVSGMMNGHSRFPLPRTLDFFFFFFHCFHSGLLGVKGWGKEIYASGGVSKRGKKEKIRDSGQMGTTTAATATATTNLGHGRVWNTEYGIRIRKGSFLVGLFLLWWWWWWWHDMTLMKSRVCLFGKNALCACNALLACLSLSVAGAFLMGSLAGCLLACLLA